MTLSQRSEMRRCGKPYPTEEDAARSKRVLSGSAVPVSCVLRCGFWHLEAVRTSQDTGFSAAVKLAVRTRAGSGDAGFASCENCNVWLGYHRGEVQHRVARLSGGRGPKAPWWVSAIVNAGLLCGAAALGTGCHGRAERRDRDMGEDAAGWWVKDGPHVNPALVPVMLHGDQGGRTVWLGEDGTYLLQSPEVAA